MKIRLHMSGYPDSDEEERAELAWRLEAELRDADLEIDEVSRPPAQAPAGAKGSAMDWAQLVVALAGTLPPFVSAVMAWKERHPGASLVLEVDGDALALDELPAGERSKLIAAWLERHGGQ
jgi:hypothetical protein